MSKFMLNGKPYGGSTNYASSVVCTDAEGNESTVQAEIDKNRDDIDELNKKIKYVEISGNTDTSGFLTPQNKMLELEYYVISAYSRSSQIVLPMVAMSDNTWRFKFFQSDMNIVAEKPVNACVYYIEK